MCTFGFSFIYFFLFFLEVVFHTKVLCYRASGFLIWSMLSLSNFQLKINKPFSCFEYVLSYNLISHRFITKTRLCSIYFARKTFFLSPKKWHKIHKKSVKANIILLIVIPWFKWETLMIYDMKIWCGIPSKGFICVIYFIIRHFLYLFYFIFNIDNLFFKFLFFLLESSIENSFIACLIVSQCSCGQLSSFISNSFSFTNFLRLILYSLSSRLEVFIFQYLLPLFILLKTKSIPNPRWSLILLCFTCGQFHGIYQKGDMIWDEYIIHTTARYMFSITPSVYYLRFI